jgi:acetolactate synthase I/II/III large subunit
VPLDIQSSLVDEEALRPYDPAEDAVAQDGPERFAQVLELLQAARRPVIIAGHGLRISGAVQAFLGLLEQLRVPVVGTFNGVDAIPTEHPSFIGRIGTLGGRAGNFALQNADLLISIGSRNNIRQVSYFWQSYARAAKKVVVDIDAAELKKHTLVPDLAVQMDAKAFVTGLSKTLAAARLPDYSPWLAWCSERKRRYPAVQTPEPGPGRLDPYRFIERLTEVMSEDAVVVAGDGTACVAPFQVAKVRGSQRFIWNSGCAAMGYCIPAAIGASVGRGRKQVLCLSGDGSAMLNFQELATIAYQRLPIVIFLLNNNGYISIRQTQNAYFNGRLHGVDGDSGVGFPNFRAVASAFGLATELIADPAEVDAKLKSVLAAEGPLLCEVMLPHDYAFTPKLSSARLPDGRMVSKPLEDLSPLLDRDEFRSNMIVPVLEE